MAVDSIPTTTFFVGRDNELGEISRLMANPSCRLLTLTGPAGIGKTRLALEVALRQASRFADGFCFVPLQPLHSHEFILSSLAEGLRCPVFPNQDLLAQLLGYLREKSLLLVLDNFEHLLQGVDCLGDIIANAPQVKLLVTSRERLNLAEEWVYDLQGLSYPPDERDTQVEAYGAVQLFLQNARRVRHGFKPAAEQRLAIGRICRLVGGIPLGIELAAAWVRVLSCEVIADEIACSLDILETASESMPPRHRSMRAAIEPTWNRLTVAEQDVFKKLSVFRGNITLEAAQAVTGATRHNLRSLVDKSLLQMDGNSRYALHELLRQYGEEQLGGSPEDRELALDQHRAYFMRFLGERESQIVFLGQQKEAIARIGEDLANVRVAWRRTVVQGRFAELINGCEGLWGYYCMLGWDQEGADVFRWSAAELRKFSVSESEAYLRVLAAILAFQGLCAQPLSEDEARTAAEESLSILRHLPVGKEMIYALQLEINLSSDDAGKKSQLVQECMSIAREQQGGWWISACIIEMSGLAINRGDYAEARVLLYEILTPIHQQNYEATSVHALTAFSHIALVEGKFAEAQSWAEKALVMVENTGYSAARWWVHSRIADCALLQRDYATAQAHYEIGLASARELNDRLGMTFELNGLGCVAIGMRDYAQARHYLHHALCCAQEINLLPGMLDSLAGYAELLAATSHAERALQLANFVANQPFQETITRARNDPLVSSLQAALPPGIVERATQRAEHQELEKTVNVLLAELAPVNDAVSRVPLYRTLPNPLTEREAEVLRLIAQGLSNQEIAIRLCLEVSTVKTHINRILSKLDAKSRTQAAARARELHLT